MDKLINCIKKNSLNIKEIQKGLSENKKSEIKKEDSSKEDEYQNLI